MQKLLKLGTLLKFVGAVIVVIVVVNAGLWLTGHTELAIAMLVFVAALVSFVVASAWSALLLRAGAELTLRSQESDDERDIAQAKVTIEMIKAMRQMQGQPTLPMPQQQQNWLPELSEFAEGEFEEITHD